MNNNIDITAVASGVGTAYLSGALEFNPVFCGLRVQF